MGFDTEIRLILKRLGFDEAKRDIASTTRSLEKLSGLGRKLTSFGKTISLGVTVPLAGLGAVALKTASDFEEAQSKFATIFRDIEDDARRTAETFAKDFGQSVVDSFALLGNTGDLLTGFGFAQDQALQLSNEVNRLAVDLASFTNFVGGAEGASSALTKALLGETEALKSLGVAIRQDDVAAKVEALEASGRFTDETERQRKAIATLAIAFEQSKNAVGDFARTQDSFANLLRRARAEFENLSVRIGQVLIPTFKTLLNALLGLFDIIRDIPQPVLEIGVAFAAVAAAIGPVALGVGGLVTAFSALPATLVAVLGPIGLVATGIGAIAGALLALENNFGILNVMQVLFASAFGGVLKIIDDVLSVIETLPGRVGGSVEGIRASVQEAIKGTEIAIEEGVDASFERLNAKNKEFEIKVTPKFELPRLDLGNDAAQALGLDEDENTFESGLRLNTLEKIRAAEERNYADRARLAREFDEEQQRLEQRRQEALQQTADTFTNTFTNAFTSIADGTKGVAQAFDDLAQNIIRSLFQQQLQRALGSLFGSAFGVQAAEGGFVSGFATGGMVRGPGTGTSDSIPARLSNGEFVMPANRVKQFGVSFFEALRRGITPGFQGGGFVGNQATGNLNDGIPGNNQRSVSVNIQNSGTPKNASAEFDPQSGVVNILLDDLTKNGEVSQAISQRFRLKS